MNIGIGELLGARFAFMVRLNFNALIGKRQLVYTDDFLENNKQVTEPKIAASLGVSFKYGIKINGSRFLHRHARSILYTS